MTESRWQVETGMKDMSNSSASSSLNQVDGGVIHVTDRSHKYNAGWYRDEFAPVRFVRAGFYITRRQSDKCKVVQRYAPLSEYFRRGAFILLMDMSDKSGWYRAGAPLHGCFPWRRPQWRQYHNDATSKASASRKHTSSVSDSRP